jgi:excisionase family DNA binding protein
VNQHEAARRLGVSVRTIERLRKKKKLGYYPVEGAIVIGEEHLSAYLASIEVKPVWADNPKAHALNCETTDSGRSSGPTVDVLAAVQQGRRIARKLILS